MGRAHTASVIGVALVGACLGGCVTMPPRYVVESENLTFGYRIPDGAKASKTNVVLAVVRPSRTASSSILGAMSPTMMAPTRPGQLTNPMVMTHPEVQRRVNVTLQALLDAGKVDLEKVFIAKGLRTMGPFADINEMTFSQKRDATFALAPEIHLNLDQTGSGNGDLSAAGWFSLILIEPLSGQKIWAKKIEVPSQSAAYSVTDKVDFGLAVQHVVTDNRARVAADVLNRFYQQLMTQVWRYADPEEFVTLVSQADELKARAAPGMTAPRR